jgi:GH24 family phage-related lysozyme (muramidase)
VDHAALKALLTEFEGRVSHLYLDTATPPRATIGVGHMIPNAAAATKLPFVLRSGLGATPPIAATQAEILKEFAAVTSQEGGRVAGWYAQFCLLCLTDVAIDALLESDIVATELQLTSGLTAFRDFQNCPEPAQDGALDMAFNLGVHGLATKFPNFCAAFERKDWATCAAECQRNGVSEARNEAVKEMFLKA